MTVWAHAKAPGTARKTHRTGELIKLSYATRNED